MRTVDAYYEEGAFYVVAYALSRKMRQIQNNPEVAISGEWFTARVIGENLGHVYAEKNRSMMIRLRETFASRYGNGHVDESDANTCLLRIRLTEGILFNKGIKYTIDFGTQFIKD